MKNIFLFKLLISSLLLSVGCYYDNEEQVYPTPEECNTEGVTFSGPVLDIITKNCFPCHTDAVLTGNVTLEGYDNVKKYVDNGKLVGVINHRQGFSFMPKNREKLLDCDIAKIEEWVNQGAPNN